MKKAISLVVILSLLTFSIGFVTPSYADEILQAAQAANEAGATSGEKVEKGLNVGAMGLATALILLGAGAWYVFSQDDDDDKNGSTPGHP